MTTDLQMTRHATARMQQRGIRLDAVEALLDNGRTWRAPGGCDIVVFRKKYAILGSDGTVVTVGHRYKRILRA